MTNNPLSPRPVRGCDQPTPLARSRLNATSDEVGLAGEWHLYVSEGRPARTATPRGGSAPGRGKSEAADPSRRARSTRLSNEFVVSRLGGGNREFLESGRGPCCRTVQDWCELTG